MKSENILELNDVSKSFPGVKAVDNVSFFLKKGEAISLMGQNGAGKSSLVSLIGGIYRPDSGAISIDGKICKLSNPAISEKMGIGMVHQEPTLVPGMNVAANIFLNKEKLKKKFTLDFNLMYKESKKIINYLGFDIDPYSLVKNLTLVEREVVEIAKAMLLNPKILILDEVTAPLSEDEAQNLFKLIDELKRGGMAIIFISHRLKEVINCSDRIYVLRNGRKVGELNCDDDLSEKHIIDLMLGTDNAKIEDNLVNIENKNAHIYDKREKPVLSAEKLTKTNYFSSINFHLYENEILGLMGIKGSGITELLKTIFGLMKPDCGRVKIDSKEVVIKNPSEALHHGIGMITNDRQKEGLALKRNIKENMTISSLKKFLSIFGVLLEEKLIKTSKTHIDKLDLKSSSEKQEVMFLSGGNQQKVVISKWLVKDLRIFLIDEPTRGVDVKAISEIHKILLDLKSKGKSIMITSPETRELMDICDRILIISKGRIVNQVVRSSPKFNESYILEQMHS